MVQGEARDEVAGEFDLVGRAVGVGEGEREGALALGDGALAGDTVLLGLGAGGVQNSAVPVGVPLLKLGEPSGDVLLSIAHEPPHLCRYTVPSPSPAGTARSRQTDRLC
ncbi:hypothetical protein ACFFSH_40040 [Streptomyces filamentosus]|uniref:hypothetical protein n=1 Tax=Streptomyces filamentosus TaxID=67294 RepID=UPI00167372C9|nr:hypothetical protein [Streptomyces filamentosus]